VEVENFAPLNAVNSPSVHMHHGHNYQLLLLAEFFTKSYHSAYIRWQHSVVINTSLVSINKAALCQARLLHRWL